MARRFKDKQETLWIASKIGSMSSRSVSIGMPREPARMDLDLLKMEQPATKRNLLATLRRGQWEYATNDQLRGALEQALILYEHRRQR